VCVVGGAVVPWARTRSFHGPTPQLRSAAEHRTR
jgi:hypothetical protein